jgi:hypothetical protein
MGPLADEVEEDSAIVGEEIRGFTGLPVRAHRGAVENHIKAPGLEQLPDGLVIAQIELRVRRRSDIVIAPKLLGQVPSDKS